MTDSSQEMTIRQQLERAARDLWAMVQETGDTYVVFMDRRSMSTRVEQRDDNRFYVSWEEDNGIWTAYDRPFENLREAAFHGYQGPH